MSLCGLCAYLLKYNRSKTKTIILTQLSTLFSFAVPFKEAPKFNPRRRTSGVTTFSSPRNTVGMQMPQNSRLDSHSPRSALQAGVPSSPSPSDRSLPPFSSGSSISETTSTGSGSSSMVGGGGMPTNKINNNKQQTITQQNQQHQQPISLLQQSLQNSLVIHEDEQLDSASILAVSLGNGEIFLNLLISKKHKLLS